MVDQVLNEKLIEDGRVLLQNLDDSGLAVKAALWIYLPDLRSWRLMLSFPDVRTKGPKAAYTRVQSALNKLKKRGCTLALDEVSVAAPDAPLMKLLRGEITTNSGIHGIRFTQHVIDGQLVEDAYIYRLMAG